MTISRGKTSGFADYPVGSVTIQLNNEDRTFDPTVNENLDTLEGGFDWNPSVYMGRRMVAQIGIGRFDGQFGVLDQSVTDFGPLIFNGYTYDWNLGYSTSGESIATLTLFDYSGLLNKIPLDAETPSAESSGDRYDYIYTTYKPVGIPGFLTDLGNATVGTQPIAAGTSMLEYLNLIARTEGGDSFNGRFGQQTFLQRIRGSNGDVLALGLGGIGITALEVNYGTELLYNKVTISNSGGATVVVENTDSQDLNGIKDLTISNLIGADEDNATALAAYYAQTYGTAKVRFTGAEVSVSKYDQPGLATSTQLDLINTEIGDFVSVSYQPNNIGDTITQYAKIIGIQHRFTPESYFMNFTLNDVGHDLMILDDPVFGRLDANRWA